jgi:hypothetical protein
MAMKNSNDTIGNRIRDLPACSAVPQSTAPTHVKLYYQHINEQIISRNTLSFNNYYEQNAVFGCDFLLFHSCPVSAIGLTPVVPPH